MAGIERAYCPPLFAIFDPKNNTIGLGFVDHQDHDQLEEFVRSGIQMSMILLYQKIRSLVPRYQIRDFYAMGAQYGLPKDFMQRLRKIFPDV